jgi:hypothetical protein
MSIALSRVGLLMLIGSCTVAFAYYGRELIAVDRCRDATGIRQAPSEKGSPF